MTPGYSGRDMVGRAREKRRQSDEPVTGPGSGRGDRGVRWKGEREKADGERGGVQEWDAARDGW